MEGLEGPEKNYDDITVLSFQLTPTGTYTEHTLSLSATLWSLSELKLGISGRLSDGLSVGDYRNDVKGLEELFFNVGEGTNLMTASDSLETSVSTTSVFTKHAINMTRSISIL